MRALILGIALALVLDVSALAQDDKFTAKYLLPYCRDAITNKAPTVPSDAVMQGMCVGMIDALDFLMSQLPAEDKEYRSCPPSDATLKQTVQVVMKYIDERPERMNESFKKLAIEAIREAWPCGTN
jgi:hypothetical protein